MLNHKADILQDSKTAARDPIQGTISRSEPRGKRPDVFQMSVTT